MMDEMDNLREQLKIIGQQQLIYEEMLRQRQQSKQQNPTQTGSYFGQFW